MKSFLKLYPRSWRKRYGREMDALLEDTPAQLGSALDLLLGAAAAYGDVIRGNRILSAIGAYIHGVCVAVLLQAIGFVGLILYAQSSNETTEVALGPVQLATVMRPEIRLSESLVPLILRRWPELEWIVATVCLVALAAALVLVVTGPRWVRTART